MTYSSISGSPRKYLGFFVSVTCTPGLNSLNTNGPIEAGGFMFSGLSPMFFDVSVLLLSQTVLKALLGMLPPAPPPPRPALAGHKTFPSLLVIDFAPEVMPEI